MPNNDYFKSALCHFLVCCQMHRLFRYVNRNRLFVVNYHGICRSDYQPSVWTQLPRERFIQQMLYVKKYYHIISMQDLIEAIDSGSYLPPKAALITFDDGLRNNYSVAYPLLKKYNIPATVFLTTDYIDTNALLWFDELFFLLREMKHLDQEVNIQELSCFGNLKTTDLWPYYFNAVERLKRTTADHRDVVLAQLRSMVSFDRSSIIDDFGILSSPQIKEMYDSGLVDFGVHTANHRILQNLPAKEWNKEIHNPRKKLSELLGREIYSFCYPNGQPGLDFSKQHVDFLHHAGYKCAFTTKARLYNLRKNEPFLISRVPAGNDTTSNMAFFKLNVASFMSFFKRT